MNYFVTITFSKNDLDIFLHVHYWRAMEINVSPKITNFYCECCDYKCDRLSYWKRHCVTIKHGYRLSGNDEGDFGNTKITEYNCHCGKAYSSNSGLWKHKKHCNYTTEDYTTKTIAELPTDFKITTEMFYDLLKQNNELQKSLIAMTQHDNAANTVSTNIHNCGNNNKTFNLQFYLNETCKDAVNLTDFVNQIQITMHDLEETGKLGYAEGISRIFLKNLNDMYSTSRPIHCSNFKHETLYIKDADKWHKEDHAKPLLTNAIKQIAHKNMKKISEWQQLHPEYNNPESKQNDIYMQIVLNSMSGSTKEESEQNYNKIIKNVIKRTVIDKSCC